MRDAAFRALVPAALQRCEVWAVSPIPLADPMLEREIRRRAPGTDHRANMHAERDRPGPAGGEGVSTMTASASLGSALPACDGVDAVPHVPSNAGETNERRRHTVALRQRDDLAVHPITLVRPDETG